jgi:hypothetical protein
MASRRPNPSPLRAPARLVRELWPWRTFARTWDRATCTVPFLLLVCACGAAVREPPPSPVPTPAAVASVDPGAAETLAAFDTLAARGPTLAPGMREVARKESTTDAVELVKADARDACVRVAFDATTPVSAKLVDHAGNVLAASESPDLDGVLGARGPVCIRKGDVVRGLAEGSGVRVRWVAWEAP